MGKTPSTCPAFPLDQIERDAIELAKRRSGSPTASGALRYIMREWYYDYAPVKREEVGVTIDRELEEGRY
jgi:hypothetical protein